MRHHLLTDQVPSPRGAAAWIGGLGRGARLAAAFLLLAAAGCEEVSHRDIGDEINILVRRDDALVGPATDRLASYRRSAIPQIETAMHTAAPAGRHHLIVALEKIGDGEAIPILRDALRIDPNYGRAHALLAWCLALNVTYLWTKDIERETQATRRALKASSGLIDDDPTALTAAGAATTASISGICSRSCNSCRAPTLTRPGNVDALPRAARRGNRARDE